MQFYHITKKRKNNIFSFSESNFSDYILEGLPR
jgi:hypothetical protein